VTSSSVSDSSSLGRIRRLLRLRKNSPFAGVLNVLRLLFVRTVARVVYFLSISGIGRYSTSVGFSITWGTCA
jgi:hypothetical protein